MTKAEQILQFARQHVGKPYRLGGRGPDTWDCSGLTKMAVKAIGFDWYHGATTQWNRGHQSGSPHQYGYWEDSGGIDTMPMNKLVFLFNKDKAKPGVMAHTGIYDGRGCVVQAGGRGGKGVHDNPLIKSAWSHWATLKGVNEEMAKGLMIGSSGPEVRAMQQALIDLRHDLGTFGPNKNGVDGKFGPMTEKAVKQFQAVNGLPETGEWGRQEEAMLEVVQRRAEATPPAPETPEPINRAALLAELDGLNKRQAAIIHALKEVG